MLDDICRYEIFLRRTLQIYYFKNQNIINENQLYRSAKRKFKILEEHGFSLMKKEVKDTVKRPEIVLEGKRNRFIAQKSLDNDHLLRGRTKLK
ncbi:MAG: hypothetical protein ISS48_03630 [Candidatus Aenigmarchaeota archaeon]|nr:hypothetical protein [Candidatus Aenigmarchaeota archaeon]